MVMMMNHNLWQSYARYHLGEDTIDTPGSALCLSVARPGSVARRRRFTLNLDFGLVFGLPTETDVVLWRFMNSDYEASEKDNVDY